jgi:hypothetical protein
VLCRPALLPAGAVSFDSVPFGPAEQERRRTSTILTHADSERNAGGQAGSRPAGDRPSQPEPRPDEIPLSQVIETVPLHRLREAVLNDRIYKPIDLDDPSIKELGRDIAEKGILDPLVITLDDVIVSGHRRRGGALVAGLDAVPVRRISIDSADPRFDAYLVACNMQRVKTPAEQIKEEIVRTRPEDAYLELLKHRAGEAAGIDGRVEESGLRVLDPKAARARSAVSAAKRPMLDAALAVIEQYRDYWPLTLRQVHYRLLTRHVLRNAKKPASVYVNSPQCYKDLSDLLTRARLAGLVPWTSMHDPTRPRTRWPRWDNVAPYMRQQLDKLLGDYHRDLLQGQPAYVELVVEKITVHDIAKRAARPYQVPVSVGRGYSSVTSLDETAARFRASGKDRFILLIAGDFDPEGENICETWAACLRDEHGVENLTTIKVGVNPDQIGKYNLSPLPVKKKSSRAARFEAAHGGDVYELEAFEPDVLQEIIRDAIRRVLDMGLFAQEELREPEDARCLMACRRQVQELLKGCDLERN